MSTSKTASWNEANKYITERNASGTGDMATTTFSGLAAVDNSDGTVTITTDQAHGFLVDSWVLIDGTTNYDGEHLATAIPTTSGITFTSSYTAEEFDGTETIRIGIAPEREYQILEINFHLSAVSATNENYTIDKDAEAGAAWDINLLTEDLNTKKNSTFTSERYFMKGDKIICNYANSDSRTWGVDFTYRRA